MRASLALCLLIAPAMLGAQWKGYSPDSAEYRLTVQMQNPNIPDFSVGQEMRALVVAQPLGRDSLLVRVTMLKLDFGSTPFRMELPPPIELRMPKSGYVFPMTVPGMMPPMGPSVFPTLFAQVLFAPLDAQGRLLQEEQQPQRDSLERLGVTATTHATDLPDTTVHGVSVTRRRTDMSMHADHEVVIPWGSGARLPAMDMNVTSERWTDPAQRVFVAVMSQRMKPKDAPGLTEGVTMTMRMERVFPP